MMILVTGASGFIGSHLCKKLTEKGEKVIAQIHNWVPSKWLSEALRNCIKVRGDIRDFAFLRRIIARYEISRVYHLAAVSIVKTAFRDPINVFDVNVMGTVKLLEACRQIGVKKVIVQSTDKVYGEQENAVVWKTPLIPTEPYGTSKICADVIAQSYTKTYGMNIIITRPCNTYGFDLSNRIVPNTIRACLRGQSPIIYKNDKSKRQYIYVEDLTSALIYLMEHEPSWITSQLNAVNIATEDILDQEQVVLKILEFFPELEPRYVEKPRLKEIKSQSMIPSDFGWKPKYSFGEGIELTIGKFKRYKEDWM